MLINPIQQNFGCSRVSVSKKLPKEFRKALKASNELKQIAKNRNVYLNFAEVETFPKSAIMTIAKRGIDHVADVPEYALKNNTGDSIYIPWEKVIMKKSINTDIKDTISTVEYYLNP